MKNTLYENPIIMRTTPILILLKIIFLTFIFNLFFIFISIIYTYLRQYYWSPNISQSTVFIILFISEILIFIKIIVSWLSEYMFVNDTFILYKKWIFNIKETRYNLDKINNIEVQQSFIWQILRYWNIYVSVTNDQTAKFNSIPYPNQFLFLVEQKIELAKKKNKELLGDT